MSLSGPCGCCCPPPSCSMAACAGAGTERRGHQRPALGASTCVLTSLVADPEWESQNSSVSAGMGRLPYSAGANWCLPCSHFLPQMLSSPGTVIYTLICLLTVGLRSVWEMVIVVLSLIPIWRSAFDAILLCFKSRLFLSHQVNPNPHLGQ